MDPGVWGKRQPEQKEVKEGGGRGRERRRNAVKPVHTHTHTHTVLTNERREFLNAVVADIHPTQLLQQVDWLWD